MWRFKTLPAVPFRSGLLASRLRVRCLAALCLLPLLAACGGGAGSEVARPRHLLLVTLDTVRADHLGAYGYAAAETPNLDHLAQAGLRFDQAMSPVPLTLPSHASLLTGRLPLEHGVRHNGARPLAAGTETLATRLTTCGFDTAAFVGAFVLDHRFGLNRGFGHYDDDIARDPGRDLRLEAERPASEVVDRALAWLAREEAAPARPQFLWLHLYDAHAPYTPPAPFAERHPDQPYDGEIAAVDAQLGRLLAAVRQRLGADVLVAVVADHGESLGDHGESTHGLLLYQPVLRVPLLLAGPGLPAGRTVATPVGLTDLAPTLAGLLGCAGEVPLGTGRDLSGYLRAGDEPPGADLYAETQYPTLFGWSPLTALRRGAFKYIAGPRPELYDLNQDRGEEHDLLHREPATARPLAARLEEMQASAPGLVPGRR